MPKDADTAVTSCFAASTVPGEREDVAKEIRTLPIFVVRPANKWELIDFKEIWSSRQVFWAFLWRNVFRRNRQTLLGPFWFVITPLVRMLLFSIALGKVAGLPSEGIPYPIFTFAALLPWELFSSGVLRSSESLVTYEHIISKVYFPRIVVPACEVFGALVDFGWSLVILLVMIVAYGFPLTLHLLLIPVFVGLALAQALGMGLLFSGLHARYRDTSRLLGYVIQILFYITPVAYSETIVANRLPQWLMTIYRLNPMYQVVKGVRWAVLPTASAPDFRLVLGAAVPVALCLVIGAAVFANTEHSIVDMI